jgi:hypothetical protein
MDKISNIKYKKLLNNPKSSSTQFKELLHMASMEEYTVIAS